MFDEVIRIIEKYEKLDDDSKERIEIAISEDQMDLMAFGFGIQFNIEGNLEGMKMTNELLHYLLNKKQEEEEQK